MGWVSVKAMETQPTHSVLNLAMYFLKTAQPFIALQRSTFSSDFTGLEITIIFTQVSNQI